MEYNEILKMVSDPSNQKEDVYTALVTKEEQVLNTINRMVEKEKKESNNLFMHNSLFEIITAFALTWKRIYQEIVIFKQRDILTLFYHGERKIYLGIMIVLVSLLLYFIDISR